MKKITLSSKQQLKCNFCTRWFSVESDFARIQRYSVNACVDCMEHFKYQLVHPKTYHIYQIVLLDTGFTLTHPTSDFYDTLELYHTHHCIGNEDFQKVKQVQQQVNEVKVHAQSESSQIKEAGSKLCQQIIKDVLKMWNDVLMSLRKVEELFHKDETDRLEELSKGAEAVDKWMDKLEMLKEEVTYVLNHTNANLLPKLKHFNQKVFPTKDKENIPITLGGLNKKSMKVFRDKVTSQQQPPLSARQNRENIPKKINTTTSKIQKKLNRSVRADSNSSSTNISSNPMKKSLLRSRRSSQASLSSLDLKWQDNGMDEYRNQIINLLKEKVYFDSYLQGLDKSESQLEVGVKPVEESRKIWGDKSMVERILELRMKTLINDEQCQIINENLSGTNVLCYLKCLPYHESINVVKLVKTALNDEGLDQLLHWLSNKQNVEIVVLTNNHLTEASVRAVLQFVHRHKHQRLRAVYMGNNWIKPHRVRQEVQQLRANNIILHI